MENKFIALAVGLTVGVIMLSGFLWPVVSDAISTETTFKNTGYFYVDNPSEEINLILEDGLLSVNGEIVTAPENTTYPDGITILSTENAIFRYYNSELRSRGGLIGYHSFNTCDLVFNNGAVTGTYTPADSETPTTVNATYTELTVISPTVTDRIMCKNITQYVNSNSIIKGAGVIWTPSLATKYWVAEFEGSIENGLTVRIFGQSTGTPPTTTTIANAQINYVESSTHDDLYLVESITFDVVGESSTTDQVTFTTYIVPAEVTAEKSYRLDTTQIALVTAIGTLGAIVLIAAAAGSIRRLD